MAKYKHIGTMPLAVGEAGEGRPSPRVVAPGDEFDAVISPEQEAFWIKARVIEEIDAVDRRGSVARVPLKPVKE